MTHYAKGDDALTFKKNGADPVLDRAPYTGGFKWIGAIAAALGLIPDPAAERRAGLSNHEHYRAKRPQQKTKKHRNMMHVSKRVRRKHRRAA